MKCGKIILVLVYVFTFGLVEVDYFVSVYHCVLKKHYATSFLSSLGFMETHIPQISEVREFWGWVHYSAIGVKIICRIASFFVFYRGRIV